MSMSDLTRELTATFKQFDKNDDGSIDREELARVLAVCAPSFSGEKLEYILSTADTNGDGKIDYTEFVDWLSTDEETALILGVKTIQEQTLRNNQQEYADSKQELESLRKENAELRQLLASSRTLELQLRREIRDLRLAELDRLEETKQAGDDKKAVRHAHEQAKREAKESFLETFNPVLRDLIDEAEVIQREANTLDDTLSGPFTSEQRAQLKVISESYDRLALRAMQELREEVVQQAREKVKETEAGFRQVYVSILQMIRNDEESGYNKVVEVMKSLPSRQIQNSVSDVADLVDEASLAQPRVSELASSIGTQVDELKLQNLPIKTSGKRKKLGRIQEKLNNSALHRQNAARVYDCARAMLEFENMDALHAALEKVCASVADGTIEIDRVKDRFSNPSGGGWADAMVNFHFVEGEAAGHVCEFQFVHKKLLLARAGLGGHDAYGAFRATLELLELLADVEAACNGNKDWTSCHSILEWAEVRSASQRPVDPVDEAIVEAALRLGEDKQETWTTVVDLLGRHSGGPVSWARQFMNVALPRDFAGASAFAERCGMSANEVRGLKQRRGGIVTVSAGEQAVKSWDALTGQELRTYDHAVPGSPSMSTTGAFASSSKGFSSTAKSSRAGKGGVEGAALSPDSEFVYTVYNTTSAKSVGGMAKKWKVTTGEVINIYDGGFSEQLRCCVISADGRYLVLAGNKGQVKKLDEESGEVLTDFYSGQGSDVLEARISGDDKYLFTAHNAEKMVKKFDFVNGPELIVVRGEQVAQPLLTFTGHPGAVVAIALSADGSLLAVGSTGTHIFLWDANTGDLKHRLNARTGCKSECLAFSSDGKLYAPGMHMSLCQ
eukprot:TRINITY_DN79162_c0_g1_i1.p1 TRINITY_DN79162_c0_g1~~TRINITY_DN79162_c0_g1_i1.p1  ORF type:complete len:844 (+),score=189.50 TRINITY_DN79162_c0_g1_i1:210-2741(+)